MGKQIPVWCFEKVLENGAGWLKPKKLNVVVGLQTSLPKKRYLDLIAKVREGAIGKNQQEDKYIGIVMVFWVRKTRNESKPKLEYQNA